jgi:hypothetical protein
MKSWYDDMTIIITLCITNRMVYGVCMVCSYALLTGPVCKKGFGHRRRCRKNSAATDRIRSSHRGAKSHPKTTPPLQSSRVKNQWLEITWNQLRNQMRNTLKWFKICQSPGKICWIWIKLLTSFDLKNHTTGHGLCQLLTQLQQHDIVDSVSGISQTSLRSAIGRRDLHLTCFNLGWQVLDRTATLSQ